jgi:XapX domain-containing protein
LAALEMNMKAYVASLTVGCLGGVIYALFNVRSPVPPVIALVGLLGILLGEQVPSLIMPAFMIEKSASAWVEDQVMPHVFGHLSQRNTAQVRLPPLKSPPHTTEGTHHG